MQGNASHGPSKIYRGCGHSEKKTNVGEKSLLYQRYSFQSLTLKQNSLRTRSWGDGVGHTGSPNRAFLAGRCQARHSVCASDLAPAYRMLELIQDTPTDIPQAAFAILGSGPMARCHCKVQDLRPERLVEMMGVMKYQKCLFQQFIAISQLASVPSLPAEN